MSDTPLVDALSTHLPGSIGSNLLSHSRPALEAILAFALGAECPSHLANARTEWSRSQPAALNALHHLLHPSHKRARDTDAPEDPAPKRPKPIAAADDSDDLPQFTIPSISTTSPVRKKVDLAVHARTLRFLNPSTRALEASLPLASITRTFLLPTRGKPKPHWTVVLLTADATDKAKPAPQVIFGLDARTTTTFDTTTYVSGKPARVTTLAKGDDTAPVLRTLLVHVPVALLEPSPAIFRSACANAPTAGIDAYLGAKSGTLWFLDGGILWGESKPCAFWAVEDLLRKDGVRLISATGRTCSVVLTRARVSEDEGEDEDEGEETAFSMIDGREQDPINVWVRHRKHLFGKHASGAANPAGGGQEARQAMQVANATVQGPAWDDSDSDDDDFEASSENLDSTDDGGEDDDGDEDAVDEDEASAHASSQDEEEEEELDAAIDAVVAKIRRDFVDNPSEEEDEASANASSQDEEELNAEFHAMLDKIQRDFVDNASEEEDELEE